jgi:hypothetical protein
MLDRASKGRDRRNPPLMTLRPMLHWCMKDGVSDGVRTRCSVNEPLYTPFFNTYAQIICKNSSACLDHAVIPPYSEQVEIMKAFNSIVEHVDITNVEDVVFKSLIIHDVDKLNDLLVLLQEHMGIVKAISTIVEEFK